MARTPVHIDDSILAFVPWPSFSDPDPVDVYDRYIVTSQKKSFDFSFLDDDYPVELLEHQSNTVHVDAEGASIVAESVYDAVYETDQELGNILTKAEFVCGFQMSNLSVFDEYTNYRNSDFPENRQFDYMETNLPPPMTYYRQGMFSDEDKPKNVHPYFTKMCDSREIPIDPLTDKPALYSKLAVFPVNTFLTLLYGDGQDERLLMLHHLREFSPTYPGLFVGYSRTKTSSSPAYTGQSEEWDQSSWDRILSLRYSAAILFMEKFFQHDKAPHRISNLTESCVLDRGQHSAISKLYSSRNLNEDESVLALLYGYRVVRAYSPNRLYKLGSLLHCDRSSLPDSLNLQAWMNDRRRKLVQHVKSFLVNKNNDSDI